MDARRFERLHAECGRIIGGLRKQAGFPTSDYGDLEQEMALALLEVDGHTDSYCLGRAAWAARKWLRKMHGGLNARPAGGIAELDRLAASASCRRVWC